MMTRKKFFMLAGLILVLALGVVARGKYDKITPEVEKAETIVTEESEETLLPTTTRKPKNFEKVPKGAKVFHRYESEKFKIFRKKNTFYLAKKRRVLAKTTLDEDVRHYRNKKNPYSWRYPYCYSTNNLYVIQARLKNPKLEFIKVSDECQGIVATCEYRSTHVPVFKTKTGYGMVDPWNTDSYNDYVWWKSVESSVDQWEKWSNFDDLGYEISYNVVKFEPKDIYVDVKIGVESNHEINIVYYLKERDCYLELMDTNDKFLPEIPDFNCFAIEIMKSLKVKTMYELEMEKVRYDKLSFKKIDLYMNDWVEKNSEKIFDYCKKDSIYFWQALHQDKKKKGMKAWLKAHPEYQEQLMNNLGKFFIKEVISYSTDEYLNIS